MNPQKKTNWPTLAIVFIFILSMYACKEKIKTDLTQSVIIPLPTETTADSSAFYIKKSTMILVRGEDESSISTGQYLSDYLQPATGFTLPVESADDHGVNGNILLEITTIDLPGPESYILDISENSLQIKANGAAGIFYGIQTLIQVLPDEIVKDEIQSIPWIVPTGMIRDAPAYVYRGSMLDVSRHFFSVEDVKTYIDHLARYKMNILHLGLSNDQGWRIEIKSWPKLASYGGSTQVGGGEGGFYTQQDYTEIVTYAQQRFITIIPEIDIPGHTNAALASYAELNCNGVAPELYTGTRVGFSTLCAKKPVTYQFMDDVIRELASITPGPFIHMGGDESDVTEAHDYIQIVDSAQAMVSKYGKRYIGWGETAQANLSENDVIQHWRPYPTYADMAVEKNLSIIMSPAAKTYLDMKYDSTTVLGLSWAGYITVDSAYNWDPANFNENIPPNNILGIEAPLWSETITNMDEIESMIFPRIICLAEIGWTQAGQKNWDGFKERLGKHGVRMEQLGVNFYKSPEISWSRQTSQADSLSVTLE